jgi:hypothetical protein
LRPGKLDLQKKEFAWAVGASAAQGWPGITRVCAGNPAGASPAVLSRGTGGHEEKIIIFSFVVLGDLCVKIFFPPVLCGACTAFPFRGILKGRRRSLLDPQSTIFNPQLKIFRLRPAPPPATRQAKYAGFGGWHRKATQDIKW